MKERLGSLILNPQLSKKWNTNFKSKNTTSKFQLDFSSRKIGVRKYLLNNKNTFDFQIEYIMHFH